MKPTRWTGTLAAARRAAVFAAALAVAAGLSGCALWTREGRRAWLQTIPVTTPELSTIADGTYSGSYRLKLPPGGMAANSGVSVDVTVAGGAITAIVINAPEALAKGAFYDGLVTGPKGVIANQSLDLDAVTGASYTEKAFLKAVEAALAK